ncbi:MAG TPA: hypothetical protein PK971_15495 [Saprospiraceae bacterium]|nr:hypothetical protein [Saprospiraceae bacterium]HND89736.1 hypothetical protein [Saprospiraceae bacterium]
MQHITTWARHWAALFFLLSLQLLACRDFDGDRGSGSAKGRYERGVFVVNEGPFGGTGSITWYDPDTGESEQDIFAKANNGVVLGQFVQSLTFHEGKAYIVVNGANRIVVADAATFEYLDTIGGLTLPRYFLPIDANTAWVSQWGANGVAGSIAKVDLATRKVLKTIALPGPEDLYRADDNTLLVANIGGFGLDSTVSFIRLDTETELSRKTLPGTAPGGFARAPFLAGGPLVLCKGGFRPPAFTPLPGWVGSLSTGVGTAIPNSADDPCDAPDGQAVYFSGGGSIWAMDAGGVRKLFDQAAYGLACHPATGYLYCADAKDFNSNGRVSIRKPDGTLLGGFDCGIAPGEVVVRK